VGIMRTGVIVGASLAVVDLLLIGAVVLEDRTGGLLVGLVEYWVLFHRPMMDFLNPLLGPYMPSHGGGTAALIAITVYFSACVVYGFAVGFVVGSLVRWCTTSMASRFQAKGL
jgi:hypothetical protein